MFEGFDSLEAFGSANDVARILAWSFGRVLILAVPSKRPKDKTSVSGETEMSGLAVMTGKTC